MKMRFLFVLLVAMASAGAQTTAGAPSGASTPHSVSSSATLPPGTVFEVRVNEGFDSASASQGQRFTGMLVSPVSDDGGQVVIPRGAAVEGRLIDVKPSGRVTDSGELQLSISTVRYGTHIVNVASEPYLVKGESHAKSNAEKIGGGAVLGAIIGAVAGGAKGAAVGATVGAGAGTAGAAATGKREAKIESESVLRFTIGSDLRVPRATQAEIAQSENADYGQRPSGTNDSYPSTSSSSSQSGASPSVAPPPDTSGSDDEPVLRRRRPDTTQDQDSSSSSQAANTVQQNPASNLPSGPGSTVSPTGDSQYAFTARDRRSINSCLVENSDQLPSGATSHQDSLDDPALVKGGTLPGNLARKVRSLPIACERQLSALPNNLERVVYNGQVLLLDDNGYRILDSFNLDSY